MDRRLERGMERGGDGEDRERNRRIPEVIELKRRL